MKGCTNRKFKKEKEWKNKRRSKIKSRSINHWVKFIHYRAVNVSVLYKLSDRLFYKHTDKRYEKLTDKLSFKLTDKLTDKLAD